MGLEQPVQNSTQPCKLQQKERGKSDGFSVLNDPGRFQGIHNSKYVKDSTISICEWSPSCGHILKGGFLGNDTASEPIIC